jgi:hypothetical protein
MNWKAYQGFGTSNYLKLCSLKIQISPLNRQGRITKALRLNLNCHPRPNVGR